MDQRQNVTILCIDDEDDICFALKTLFRTQGWNTATACDVNTGLKLFTQLRPTIVLIDYHMPGINGVEGVRMLRRLSAMVPIIVFTIDECQRVADEFLAAGASDFALKPIKAPDIISRVRLQPAPAGAAEHRHQLYQGNQPRDTGADSALPPPVRRPRDSQRYLKKDRPGLSDGIPLPSAYDSGKRVEMVSIYGKVGRPKQVYRKV